MLVDAATADRSLFARTFDACVIGTGPAGITLARKLAAQGLYVALMEGGGLAGSAESQEVYEGAVVGLDYYDLDATRLRMFGGSSGHWGGRCRELDALSFEALAHQPMRAWPISKSDLDPYAAEADAILELPPAGEDVPLEQTTERFRRVEFRQSPPVVFGVKFEEELAASTSILCAYNANLVDLRLDDSLSRVVEAAFRTFDPSDPGFTIRARVFCLCLGGLENPRMLLNSCSRKPAGIGNDHDLVGRYFAEHLHLRLGDLFYARPTRGRSAGRGAAHLHPHPRVPRAAQRC
jgi:choline dehydrogenase-like flavoprotein